MPDHANLGELRNQAKDQRLGVIKGRPDARARAVAVERLGRQPWFGLA